MIGSGFPTELEALFLAILEVKGRGTVLDWLKHRGLGHFGGDGSQDEKVHQEWEIEQLARDLYAYSTRQGLERLITELFPTHDDLVGLAYEWLDEDDYDTLVDALKPDPWTVDIFLQQKVVLSELFRTYNYGLENFIEKIEDALRILDKEGRKTDKAVEPATYRGRGMDVLNDLETLLKVMLLFYQSCFQHQDELMDKAFIEAVKRSGKGLDATLGAIRSINIFFENGESDLQQAMRERDLKNKEVEFKNRISKVETIKSNAKDKHLGKIDSLAEKFRPITEQKWLQLGRIDNQISHLNHKLGDVQDNSSTDELNQQMKELEKQKLQLNKEIDEINNLIKIAKDDLQKDVAKYDNDINSLRQDIQIVKSKNQEFARLRKQMAKHLQSQCMRLFGRNSPFDGLDINKIRSIKDRYRNNLTHMPTKLLEQLIKSKGFEPVRKLIKELYELLTHLKTKRLCPETYIVLGNAIDIYRRPVVVCAKLDRKIHNIPYWSLENMRWIYRWKDTGVVLEVGKSYFMVASSDDRILFEPTYMASSELLSRLEPILSKDTSDGEAS